MSSLILFFFKPVQIGVIEGESSEIKMAEKRVAGRSNWITRDGLNREDELLTHCARLSLSQARREAVKDLLAEGLDWDLLLKKATWHRLLCLVSHHLRSTDLSIFVPQPILQKLQSLNYMSLAKNMLLQDELSHLSAAFNKEGIPIIVLKGAALLGSIYQDISLRPMSDLDILVKSEHLDRAEAIAFRKGYTYIHSRHSQEIAKKQVHQLPFVRNSKKGIVLEIHQHIVDLYDSYRFDLSGFWARAQLLKTLDADALVLAPEDLLIHLSIHFLFDRCYHSSNALGQLCDISEVILHYGDSLNWIFIYNFAKENGITAGLHCVLYTCEQLLGTQVPASVLNQLRPLDFNPAIAALFMRRRILDTKPWLPLDWMSSHLRYSRLRALLAIINKFFHIPARILEEEKGFREHKISYYSRLMTYIFPTLGRLLLRPTELRQDLLLDRWLHNIHRSTTGTRLHDRRSKLDVANIP